MRKYIRAIIMLSLFLMIFSSKEVMAANNNKVIQIKGNDFGKVKEVTLKDGEVAKLLITPNVTGMYSIKIKSDIKGYLNIYTENFKPITDGKNTEKIRNICIGKGNTAEVFCGMYKSRGARVTAKTKAVKLEIYVEKLDAYSTLNVTADKKFFPKDSICVFKCKKTGKYRFVGEGKFDKPFEIQMLLSDKTGGVISYESNYMTHGITLEKGKTYYFTFYQYNVNAENGSQDSIQINRITTKDKKIYLYDDWKSSIEGIKPYANLEKMHAQEYYYMPRCGDTYIGLPQEIQELGDHTDDGDFYYYKFKGWYTKPRGGKKITSSTKYNEKYTKLYAQYQVKKLEVEGTQLQIDEEIIIFKDCQEVTTGTGWKYVKSKETLYLGDANLGWIEGDGNLNIHIQGKNTIDGLCIEGDVSISGNGTLNLIAYDSMGWVDGNLTIKDCTVNMIPLYDKRVGGVPFDCGKKLTLDNATLVGKSVRISNNGVNAINSTVLLNGKYPSLGFGGTTTSIKNSSITVKGTSSYVLEVASDKTYIVDSEINVVSNKEKYKTPMLLNGEECYIKNSKVKAVGSSVGIQMTNTKVECSQNSKITVTGGRHGILAENSAIILNGGTITATGKEVIGLCLTAWTEWTEWENKLTIKKGTLKATGKQYGLYISEDKNAPCEFNFKSGILTLSGEKGAINTIKKLPSIEEKNIVKAGAKKSDAKKVTELKKKYKYIYFKK